MKILNFLKEHWRAVLFVLYLVACLVLTIGSLIWTDIAKTSFWWTFWEITPWIGGIGFISGCYWFSKQKNVSW
jgi:hypothetical protein